MDLLLGLAFLLMTVASVVLGLAIAIMLLRRDRKKRTGGSGSLGSAMLELQALFEPDRKHQVEEKKKVRREEDGTSNE